jgi:hypothetical protein
MPAQPRGVPTPKITFESIKKLAKFSKISLKTVKEFYKLTLGNSEFVKCKIQHFHLSYVGRRE